MTDASRNTIRSHESVVDVATISLKESLAALFSRWQAAVERKNEDSEHVHQLRVASRRATAALQLFSEFLPRRKTERLLRELDALRKSAGPARDCDVFAERRAADVSDEEASPFAEHLRNQRSDAQRTLVEHYEKCDRGEKLERQATDLLGALRPRGHRSKVRIVQFGDWAPRQLRSAVREFFADAEVDTGCLDRLHQFRIRAKQFRYSFELLQPALPGDRFKEAHSGLKKLSQRLGEINDRATAVESLTRWLSADFGKKFRRVLRRWRKDERRALRRAISEFADWWTTRRQRRLRRRLKNAARIDSRATVTE